MVRMDRLSADFGTVNFETVDLGAHREILDIVGNPSIGFTLYEHWQLQAKPKDLQFVDTTKCHLIMVNMFLEVSTQTVIGGSC